MTLPRRTLLSLSATAAVGAVLASADCGVADSSPPIGSSPPVAPKSLRPVPPVACWTKPRWYGFFEGKGVRTWPAPRPSTAMLFVKLDTNFTVARLDEYSRRGLTPFLSLEPWLQGMLLKDLRNPKYSLSTILRGDHDAQLRRIAAVVKAFGGPVLIRWAHEANGDWYPWCLGVNDNTAAKYRAVWLKVRAMFPANARWVWSVNKIIPGEPYDVPGMYPGDAACDYIGFTSYPNDQTKTVSASWDHTTAVITRITKAKSIIITETGVPDNINKVAWIATMGEYLRSHKKVVGLVWFDFDKKHNATANYGLNTTEQSRAFTAAMQRAGF